MTFYECLKFIKNRQNIGLFTIWMFFSLFMANISKRSYVNDSYYAFFVKNDLYFTHLNSFFVSATKFSGLFIILLCMFYYKNMNTLDIRNRIYTSPITVNQFKLNQIAALHICISLFSIGLNLLISFIFYVYFTVEMNVFVLISNTIFLSLLNSLAIITIISFYFFLIILLKNTQVQIAICTIIWLLSLCIKSEMFPLNWAYQLTLNSTESLNFFRLLFFCICTTLFPYYYLKKYQRTHKLLLILLLFIVAGCRNRINDIQITPNDDVLYVAFSTQCTGCDIELNEINNNISGINDNKLILISIDSESEISFYRKNHNLNEKIKIVSVSYNGFQNFFEETVFPQAVIFKRGKKIQISRGYFPIDSLRKYVGK